MDVEIVALPWFITLFTSDFNQGSLIDPSARASKLKFLI